MKRKIQNTEFKVQAIMLVLGLLFGLSIQAQYNYLGTYDSQGKPNYLEPTRDVVTQAFLDDVDASLPEGKPVPTYNPQYISTNAQTDICLKDSADVWVTFVAEGAGYKNVLGYYSYDTSNPPQTVSDINNETIIFPNVSASGSGGSLIPGDKVKIGTFSSGTGIGWFLVANGWNGRGVGNGNWKVYSNPDFNPESKASDRFHNVLLNDSTNQRIILGFEDIRRDYASCDQDFNDAIFYVSANPYTAIVTDSMNTIVDATTTVSSGGNGGLESNGNLATKIALRKFENKKQKSIDYNDFQNLPIFNQAAIKQGSVQSYSREKSNNERLYNLIPTQSLFNSTAVITTPTDLIDITNAKEVFSADYISNGRRKGAAMVMYTENKVYEHTKVVCDRLKGAELMSIQKVNINGHPFALFQLKQENGAIEYAVNFVVQEQKNGEYLVDNHWTLSEYEQATKNFNFQFWSSTTAMTIQLVKDALGKVETKGTLLYSNQEIDLPRVYVRKGEYKMGKLILTIQNNSGESEVVLNGNLSRTETSVRELLVETISLNGAVIEEVEVEVGALFDIGFRLENNQNVADVLYTADGAWGIDYEKLGASLNQYSVLENQGLSRFNSKSMERGIVANGTVTNYVSFFKNLKSGGKPIDVSEFNALQFMASSSHEVEITIVKESIKSWKDQYRVTIPLEENKELQTIFLDDLKSDLGKSFRANDVQLIVFSVKSNGVQAKSFAIEINQLAFVNAERSRFNEFETMSIYPNPINNQSVIQLDAKDEGSASFMVRNIAGTVVQVETVLLQKGINRIPLKVIDLSPGLYFCQIQSEKMDLNSKFIVQ